MALGRCFNKRIFSWKVAVSFTCLLTIYFFLYQNVNSVFGEPLLFRSLMEAINKNSPFDRTTYHHGTRVVLSMDGNTTLHSQHVALSPNSTHLSSSNNVLIAGGKVLSSLKSALQATDQRIRITNNSSNNIKCSSNNSCSSNSSDKTQENKDRYNDSNVINSKDVENSTSEPKVDIKDINNLQEYHRLLTLNRTLPLLTLFTTWKSAKSKYIAYNNTVKNWMKLLPYVSSPVVFTHDKFLSEQCTAEGWYALPIGRTAAGGAPVLKDMFREVMTRFQSLFYAFSNADILYDNSLIQTLFATAKTQDLNKPILMVGIRTNVQNVMPHEVITWDAMKSTAKRRGKLFLRNAEDYFIASFSYPWHSIPDVVIGRRAYDNWLVLNARKKKHLLIEISDTVLALHQTTKAGNFEGHRHRDGNYNLRLLTRLYGKIQYGAGSTICAPMKSNRGLNKTVIFTRRIKLMKLCYPI